MQLQQSLQQLASNNNDIRLDSTKISQSHPMEIMSPMDGNMSPTSTIYNNYCNDNNSENDKENNLPKLSDNHNNSNGNNNDNNTSNDPEISSSAPKLSALTRFRMSPNFLTFTIMLALMVDMLVYSILFALTPFLVQSLGLSPAMNGLLIAFYAAGLLIASPVSGIISDRLASRRTPMIAGLVALLISVVVFMESMHHFWLLLIARFAAGVAGGTVVTLGFALLSDTYKQDQLGEEMGKALIGQTIGLTMGPACGGALQDRWGLKAPFIFCLIFIAIDFGLRLAIIEPRTAKMKTIRAFNKMQQQQEQGDSQGQDLSRSSNFPTMDTTTTISSSPNPSLEKNQKTTMLALLKNKRLATALYISFIQAFLISALEPTLPLYIESRFHFSKTKIGLMFLAFTLPTISSPFAGNYSDKHGARNMCVAAIVLSGIAAGCIGIPNQPLWLIIFELVVVGCTCCIYITPVLGEIASVVRVTGDGDGFARAFALFNIAFSLGMVVGPLVGTLIYEHSNMFWTCLAAGLMTLTMVPPTFLFVADKTQKLKDMEQYEKDVQQQDEILEQATKNKQPQD